MGLSLLLLAFFSVVIAQNCTDRTTYVNGKISVPLTAVQNNAYCQLKFEFDSNKYAYMTLKGVDLSGDSVNGRDSIVIEENYRFESVSNSTASSTFISNLAWATNFTVVLLTCRNTTMKYQIDIETFPLTLGQNNQDTYDVSKDFQPQLLYFNDLVEGGTYYSNSHNRDIVLQTAILSETNNDTFSLGNVFVFADGIYKGSLYDVYKQQENPWLAGDIIQKSIAIYVARKPEVKHGVIILNDLDNFNLIYQAFPIYLPLYTKTQYVYEYADYKPSGADGAIILVGNKEGTPFDITEFTVTQDLGGAYFTTTSGGVQSYHKNSTRVKSAPMHFTGNLNTVYLSNGSGKICVVVN